MSLETTAYAGKLARWDGVLDWCQMLTGAGLILFMWAHMILVASVLFGSGAMDALAYFFEATGMAQVGGPFIFLAFLFHFLLAARKVPARFEGVKTIWDHAQLLRHRDTWLWLVQVGSALVILLMGTVHMWVVLTDLPISALKSAERVQTGWWMVFYLVLLPMVELHVGIGFYRIAVKWGLVDDKGRGKLHRSETLLTAIFVTIGLATLLRLWFLTA